MLVFEARDCEVWILQVKSIGQSVTKRLRQRVINKAPYDRIFWGRCGRQDGCLCRGYRGGKVESLDKA